MKLQQSLFVILLVVSVKFVRAQELEPPSPIKWYTVQEAIKQYNANPKPLLIDVYTDWCGWCKHMMKTTFASEGIANYINTHYYPVRFNAENADSIFLEKNKVFKKTAYGASGKNSELAIEMLDGRLTYPTIVYVDTVGNRYPVPGYQDIRGEEPLMYYFAENIHKVQNFDEFQKDFWFTYPVQYQEEIGKLTQKPDTSATVKWYSMEEAFRLSAENQKPVYLDIYADWNISGRVMNAVCYKTPEVANYLNENFYPVRFNATGKDTVQVGNHKFVNQGTGHPFHDITVQFAVVGSRVVFPTVVFFAPSRQPITKLQEYLPAGTLAPFLRFIGSEKYKTQTWPEYRKAYDANN